MPELVRLVYASRAAFTPTNGGGIDRQVARILMESRRNNGKRQLGGVLYYGDGCFFQCLEGEVAVIDEVFATIQHDSRHKDIKVLARQNIQQRAFAIWSMKYVPVQGQIRKLLQENGLTTFDPYRFDATTVNKMLGILTNAYDPTRGSSSIYSILFMHALDLPQIAIAMAIVVIVLILIFSIST